MCRSIHSEANAIIAASREEMIGSTLYMVGLDAKTGELMNDAMNCMMCKRMIINAGIAKVVIRRSPTEFVTIDVQKEWIEDDDSLSGKFGY